MKRGRPSGARLRPSAEAFRSRRHGLHLELDDGVYRRRGPSASACGRGRADPGYALRVVRPDTRGWRTCAPCPAEPGRIYISPREPVPTTGHVCCGHDQRAFRLAAYREPISASTGTISFAASADLLGGTRSPSCRRARAIPSGTTARNASPARAHEDDRGARHGGTSRRGRGPAADRCVGAR